MKLNLLSLRKEKKKILIEDKVEPIITEKGKEKNFY